MKKIFLILIMYLPVLSVWAKHYKGAELHTNLAYLYGRFEVRMKSAQMSGMLSSFFTYHDTPNIPAEWNEIDIETLGRYDNQTQFNVISPNQVQHPKIRFLEFNPHASFHVFAFEWTPDYIAWFVDGLEVHRQTGPHIQEMNHPQKIMMNIWPPAYPGWVGNFNPADLPAYAYYDWVRYYSYTPGFGDNFTLLWQDEFDNWNTSRWSKATHTWNGNNCDFVPENAVFYNGYLVLCLTNATNLGYNGGAVIDQDIDPPYLGWARAYPDQVKILFSEPLDPLSAGTAANYLIPGATVSGAHLLADQRSVALDVPGINLSIPHTLIATNISDLAQPPNTLGLGYTAVRPPVLLPVRLNAGGGTQSGFLGDQVWYDSLEYGHIGGENYQVSPGVSISGTSEPQLYRDQLQGLTFYRVRLTDGTYRVKLRFAETQYSAAGQRIFHIYAEGEQQFANVDIFAAVGANTAYDLEIPSLTVNDGVLEFYFKKIVGKPLLCALEVDADPTVIREERSVPQFFQLAVYPNPFNPKTTVEYTLSQSGIVQIGLYDIRGSYLVQVVSGFQAAGQHQQLLNLEGFGSGLYLLVFKFNESLHEVRKLILLK
ncbi:MAG: hypothetical protein Kow0042_27200 [Calditrichia bacterium]